MQFSKLAPDDPALQQVLDLLKNSFAYMDGRIDPASSLSRLSLQDVSAHSVQHEVWSTGVPVQACVFLQVAGDALYVGRLAVDDSLRKTGVARSLIELAESRARAQGLGFLELKVRIELQENHRAFERLGFVQHQQGRHPGYARTTFLIMRKKLL